MSKPGMKEASRPEIRLARPGDETSIAEVLREAFTVVQEHYSEDAFVIVTPSPEIVASRFDEGPMWVAVLDGRIVGTVSVTILPDEGLYIRSMAVRPASQGLGIGHRLLAAIDLYAATTEETRVFLYTTYFTPGAKEMYEKHGFNWVKEVVPEEWYGTGGLEMDKKIDGIEPI